MGELFERLIVAAISGLLMGLFMLPFRALKKRREQKQEQQQSK